MIKAIQLPTALRLEEASSPALKDPAVTRCIEVWKSTREESLANGKSQFYSGKDAASAYCAAMPPLTGYQNICDFIACVGYGLVIDIIREDRATKFLYAAQTALNSVSQQPNSQKRGVA